VFNTDVDVEREGGGGMVVRHYATCIIIRWRGGKEKRKGKVNYLQVLVEKFMVKKLGGKKGLNFGNCRYLLRGKRRGGKGSKE